MDLFFGMTVTIPSPTTASARISMILGSCNGRWKRGAKIPIFWT
ncbi:hypothetical protein ACHAWF_012396 [Thalassiosira exigua]